jgi:hypothetical protein|mmetsp:Transcript_49155/g.82406  ORF Transcript_49155/g.82406 Transcript_49155/m.82406 type:complete len:269 (-) Transcript_49155:559-1365(-)
MARGAGVLARPRTLAAHAAAPFGWLDRWPSYYPVPPLYLPPPEPGNPTLWGITRLTTCLPRCPPAPAAPRPPCMIPCSGGCQWSGGCQSRAFLSPTIPAVLLHVYVSLVLFTPHVRCGIHNRCCWGSLPPHPSEFQCSALVHVPWRPTSTTRHTQPLSPPMWAGAVCAMQEHQYSVPIVCRPEWLDSSASTRTGNMVMASAISHCRIQEPTLGFPKRYQEPAWGCLSVVKVAPPMALGPRVIQGRTHAHVHVCSVPLQGWSHEGLLLD